MFSISYVTYLWRWQPSSSIRTHRKHGKFCRCAALALWRRSQGAPLCASQHFYESRVDQRHLPFCGDVVTWEISSNGGKELMLNKKHTQDSARTTSSVKLTYSSGSSAMHRVPKPGFSNNTSPKYLIWASGGRSLLHWVKCNEYKIAKIWKFCPFTHFTQTFVKRCFIWARLINPTEQVHLLVTAKPFMMA